MAARDAQLAAREHEAGRLRQALAAADASREALQADLGARSSRLADVQALAAEAARKVLALDVC